MVCQIIIVNGRPRKVVDRKGRLYIREAIEIELEQYKHATQKAQMLAGKNFTKRQKIS